MKRFLKDTTLNMFTNFLITFALQLLFYPIINESIGQVEFGLFLSLIAYVNVFSITIGSSYSNLYLRNYNEYDRNGSSFYAFKIYYKKLVQTSVLILIILFIISATLFDISLKILVILELTCFFMTNRTYLISWLRARLNYKAISVFNLCLSLLYLLFALIFSYKHLMNVFLTFMLIEIIITLFIIFLIKKDNKTNKLNNKLPIDFDNKGIIFLVCSTLSSNAMNYIDRWIISILLTPASIPIYYAGSISIKIFSQPLNILSTVVFSYVSNMEVVKKKNKLLLLTITPIFSIVILILGMIIGPIVINVLYTSYYSAAMEIYWIICIAYSLTAMDYIFRGYIMKFYPLKFKAMIDVFAMIIFIFSAIVLTFLFENLFGIAIAQLIAFSIKNIIQYIFIAKLPNN